MVPLRPDRARERAGDRRSLRALRPRGRVAQPRAVAVQDHRLRRPAARRHGGARLARARADDAAQLDRPLRGRRGHLPGRGARRRRPGLHDAPRHPLRCHLLRPRPGASARRRVRRALARGRGAARLRESRRRAQERGASRRGREDGRLHRLLRGQPGQRRADPDLDRRLCPDGLRHRGDHGRAGSRRARLRVRRALRAADRAGRRTRGRRGRRRGRLHRPLRRRGARQLGLLQRPLLARGEVGDRRGAREARARPAGGQLPAARLAPLAPALLGLPDPGHPLRRLWDRPGPGVGAAGRPAGGRRLPAERPLAARGRRGVGERSVPRLRGAGETRDRHDGHVRRLVLVLPPLHRSAERRGAVRPLRSSTTGSRSTSTSAGSSTRSST